MTLKPESPDHTCDSKSRVTGSLRWLKLIMATVHWKYSHLAAPIKLDIIRHQLGVIFICKSWFSLFYSLFRFAQYFGVNIKIQSEFCIFLGSIESSDIWLQSFSNQSRSTDNFMYMWVKNGTIDRIKTIKYLFVPVLSFRSTRDVFQDFLPSIIRHDGSGLVGSPLQVAALQTLGTGPGTST